MSFMSRVPLRSSPSIASFRPEARCRAVVVMLGCTPTEAREGPTKPLFGFGIHVYESHRIIVEALSVGCMLTLDNSYKLRVD